MSIAGLAGLLDAGRRLAEQLMTDTCTLAHLSGESTNPSSGVVTVTFGAPYYSGPCRVQRTVGALEATAGERASMTGRLTVSVPMRVVGVLVDDRVTVTGSQSDPDLVGRVFRVRELFHKSQASARRLPVEEQQS